MSNKNVKNYIKEYIKKIKNGDVVVGEYIRKLYEIIEKGLKDRSFFLDLKKANKAIKFIELFVHHNEGRNDLLKLELWQKSIVSIIFGIVDKNGYRQFKEVFIVIARKNGKTLFASAIIAYIAFLSGEYGTKIFCLAPKLDQTDLVYNSFKQTCELEPELDELIKSRKSDMYIHSTNTSIKRIAFNAKKSDGFNPSLTICDEVSSWQGDAGLKQYEVMKSAFGARKEPLIISITTSGYIDDSIYDELFKRSTSFLKGDSKERTLLPFLYVIDDINKWDDINELKKSNPNLGVSVSPEFLKEEMVIAENSLSKKAEFLTKYCNVKQNSSYAWIDSNEINNCFTEELKLEDFRNSYCVGGIDLSQTTDLTVCCAIIEREGKLNVFSQFFMPSNKLKIKTEEDNVPYNIYVKQGLITLSGENYVDYKDCYKWFLNLVNNFRILPLKIGYDRYSAQYLVQDLAAEGFHMDDVYQGFNLTPVIRETEGLIKDKKIEFGNNNLMKIHLLNSSMKINIEEEKLRLIKISPTQRIDGTAALLDAMCVRQKWYSEVGEMLKNKRK